MGSRATEILWFEAPSRFKIYATATQQPKVKLTEN